MVLEHELEWRDPDVESLARWILLTDSSIIQTLVDDAKSSQDSCRIFPEIFRMPHQGNLGTGKGDRGEEQEKGQEAWQGKVANTTYPQVTSPTGRVAWESPSIATLTRSDRE